MADNLSDRWRMEQWEFIEKAGLELGFSREAIRKWRALDRQGVPRRHRLDIQDIADRDGFILDRAAFDDPPGPRRQPVEAA